MSSDTISIILAGGVGSRLHPLTSDRAKPAVPFGGRYRIIDFVLSNCLHSGLRKIMVLTQYKSHSLFKHLRDGWSLFNPSIGEYLSVIPPQMRTGGSWYSGTADAVYQNLYLLRRSGAKNVLILSGDHIYRMDYAALLDFHESTGGVATVASMKVPVEQASAFGVMKLDQGGKIVRFVEKPKQPKLIAGADGFALASMGIYVFSIEALCDALEEDAQRTNSSHDFGLDILPALIRSGETYGYTFGGEQGRVTADGYWRDVGTLDAYYQANLDLLANDPPMDLYQGNWPIYSTTNQSPPARIQAAANGQLGTVDNAMLGTGTVVKGGSISNSILGSNVQVGSNTKIQDCVILDRVKIGDGVQLQRCIVDKGVVIPNRTRIGFDGYADSQRFVLSDQGVVVIPRDYSFTSTSRPPKPVRNFDPPIRVKGERDGVSVVL